MKTTALSLLLTALPLLTVAQAPTEPPAPGATAADETPKVATPKLTEAQVKSVLGQLSELEKDIQQRRGSNITGILTRLRAAMVSDKEATKLLTECEKTIALRKDVDKTEARRKQEQEKADLDKKSNSKDADKDQGDIGLAVRLQIQYLILTLEAHEAKEEEFKKMVPKLQEYVATLITAAPKLKGRAFGYLGGGGGGGRGANSNAIVDAFQLQRYLEVENWTNRPLDIGGMYDKTILPLAEDDKKDLLPGLWDARLANETAFRKAQMFDGEYTKWVQDNYPALRWKRAEYLYEKGPSAISAMGDMLKVIKEYPSHPDAPSWVKGLRELVNQASPTKAVSENSPTPASK